MAQGMEFKATVDATTKGYRATLWANGGLHDRRYFASEAHAWTWVGQTMKALPDDVAAGLTPDPSARHDHADLQEHAHDYIQASRVLIHRHTV